MAVAVISGGDTAARKAALDGGVMDQEADSGAFVKPGPSSHVIGCAPLGMTKSFVKLPLGQSFGAKPAGHSGPRISVTTGGHGGVSEDRSAARFGLGPGRCHFLRHAFLYRKIRVLFFSVNHILTFVRMGQPKPVAQNQKGAPVSRRARYADGGAKRPSGLTCPDLPCRA